MTGWYRSGYSTIGSAFTVAMATISTGITFRFFSCAEFSGVLNPSPADGSVGQAQTIPGTGANAISSTALTPSQNGALLVGFTVDSSLNCVDVAAGTGWTRILNTGCFILSEYMIQGTVASQAATFTAGAGGSNHITYLMAVKAAVAPRRGTMTDVSP